MPTKQKSGLYRARVKIGVSPDGKDIYKYISGKTKKELEANRQKTIARYITGDLTPDDQLFGAYAEMWFRTYLEPSVRESTAYNYRLLLNRSIMPTLGPRNLRSIKTSDVQSLLQSITPGAVLQAKSLLGRIFNQAVSDDIIIRSPMTALKPVKHEKTRPQKRVLTAEERKKYLEIAETSEYKTVLLIQYYLGTRIGENVGLKWGDIDWTTGMVHIQRDYDFERWRLDELKTPSSNRMIPLPAKLRDHLYPIRQHPDKQITADGLDGIFDLFKDVAKQLGIDGFTSHWLRHNYVSMCWENGIDVYATARFVGHSTIRTTMDVYTHLSQQAEKANAQKVRDMF